jgi:hypothetical protein
LLRLASSSAPPDQTDHGQGENAALNAQRKLGVIELRSLRPGLHWQSRQQCQQRSRKK